MGFGFRRKRKISGDGPEKKIQKRSGEKKTMTPSAVRSIAKKVVRGSSETKHFFGSQDNVAIPGDTAIHNNKLTLLTQGDSSSQMEGNRFSPSALSIKGFIVPNDLAVTIRARITVYQFFLDDDLTTPVPGDMWGNTDIAQGFGVHSVVDTTNVGKGKRMKILWDRQFVLGTNETGDTANIPNRFGIAQHWNIFLTGLDTVWMTDAANSQGRNHIRLTAITDRTNASGDAALINYNWRLDFKDI